MLRRAGYEDVTVFERGERIGGVWHHNTYPGAACDVPSHLYEFSFAPNPRWSRRYAPQAEIQAYLEDVARRHGVLDRIRTAHRGARRALGRRARHVGAADERRPARGRRPDHRLRPALGARRCRRSPGSTASPAPRSTPRAGAMTSTSPASGWRWSAPAAARSRWCRPIQPIVEQVDVYQRSPGWTIPKMDFAYSERAQRLFERFPVLQRLDRAAIFAFMELGAAAMTGHRWLLPPVARARPPPDHQGDRRPRAARAR